MHRCTRTDERTKCGRSAGAAARFEQHHLSDRLFEEGVFAQAIGFPAIPDDRSRVRTIVTAEHSREELANCLTAFEKVGRELALI